MRTGLGRASDFPGQFVHLSQLLTTCVYIHPHLFLFSSANILTLSEGNPEVMPHRKPWCYRCPSVGRWETTTENIEQNKPTLRGVCISHRYIGTYVCDSWWLSTWTNLQIGWRVWKAGIKEAVSLCQRLERLEGLQRGYWRDQKIQVKYCGAWGSTERPICTCCLCVRQLEPRGSRGQLLGRLSV